MGRDITRPQSQAVLPRQGTSLKAEPFEHLFQHIKQTDPMLYEALKRLSRYSTQFQQQIDEAAAPTVATPVKFDKATFGLQKPLLVGVALTNYYICRKAGTFIDVAVKNKIAPDNSLNLLPTILDIQMSTDDGGSWRSLFNSAAKISIPAGSVNTLVVPKDKFGIPAIGVGNLLRIDCEQVASPAPGQYFEVVLRWE